MSAVQTLCATGLTMGFVHVLTGPDHLSAIATLSVNVGNFRAFWYGVRWGIGHSIGLIVVASIFIIMENIDFDNGVQEVTDSSSRVIEVPDRIQNLAECFVGIFMIALGSYNLYGAGRIWRQRNLQSTCHHHHCLHVHGESDEERDGVLSCDSLTAKAESIGNYGDGSNKSIHNELESSPQGDHMGIDNEDTSDSDVGPSKKCLSLCIGIFHGVAGPGGVLGVVPAVKLHNAWHSVAYLGTFCVSSIVVMGCFAAAYGSLSATWTKQNEVLAYRMEIFSASLSIFVGCTWLVLLYLGILDDVFP